MKFNFKKTLFFSSVLIVIVSAMFYFQFFPNEPMTYPSESMRVIGDSMNPLIKSGQFVNHLPNYYQTHPIRRGDIISFRLKDSEPLLVKLVVAIAGDTLELRNHSLFVNGNEVKNIRGTEYEIRSAYFSATIAMSPTVPSGSLVAFGEARKGSLDSSVFGFISETKVIGKVQITMENQK